MKEIPLKPGHYWQGFRIKIYPRKDQQEFIDMCINSGRAVYNWAVDIESEHFELYKQKKVDYKLIDAEDVFKMFTQLKKDPKYSWLKKVPVGYSRNQILNVIDGFKKYFNINCCKNVNPPSHKKKKLTKVGYCGLRNDRVFFKGDKVRIEGLKRRDLIDMDINLGWYSYYKNSKIYGSPDIYNACIKRTATGEYYFCFSTQLPIKKQAIEFIDKDHIFGIDLNVDDRFVVSNGYRSGSPNIKRLERNRAKRQSRFSKDLERKEKWEITNPGKEYIESKRAQRRHYLYAKTEKKLADVVENFIQQETTKIIRMNPSMICMENLHSEKEKNKRYINKKIAKANFYRCREVMENKCKKHDIKFVLADRHFPSSQLCSRCGSSYKIGPEKTYVCPHCGLVINRDLNAALNLQQYAINFQYSN